GVEGLRSAAVQIADGRGPESVGEGTANHQVIERLPLEAKLVVGGVAEGGVVRVTAGHVEGQLLRERQVGQDRNVQLQVELVHGVLALGRTGGQLGGITALGNRVGAECSRVVAVLVPGRESQVTGRQRKQVAGNVGEVAGGLGFAQCVLGLEQV